MPLVAQFHDFEGINLSAGVREKVVSRLLCEAELGEIWLSYRARQLIGYVAVCYGYSIELAGRDAFIDELYLVPAARGEGIGRKILEHVKTRMAACGVVALHLEVARTNSRAKKLYSNCGFASRDGYHLMTWVSDFRS